MHQREVKDLLAVNRDHLLKAVRWWKSELKGDQLSHIILFPDALPGLSATFLSSGVSPILWDTVARLWGIPDGSSGKESTRPCRRCRRSGFNSWVWKILWKRKWQPTSVFLPGESHGQRSLVGCLPWGPKESDMTEQLSTHSQALNRLSALHCCWIPLLYHCFSTS